jgi:hypothetical protein
MISIFPQFDKLYSLLLFCLSIIFPLPSTLKFLRKIILGLGWQFFALLTAVLGFILPFLLVVFIMAFSPVIFSERGSGQASGAIFFTALADSLLSYQEPGFNEAAVPQKNPFGGNGLELTSVTASFADLSYERIFGVRHIGIDLVPNKNFFEQSPLFKKVGAVVILATHNGLAKTYLDPYGALTVEVINDDLSLKTVYKHFQKILVSHNDLVYAGQPLGIMGTTGFSTGQHLHYEVKLNNNDKWLAVNPANFIH